MDVMANYDKAVTDGEIIDDFQQRNVLLSLQALGHALAHPKRHWFGLKKQAIKGIYLYGSVGAGKTFLMDLFYEEVTISEKKRFHFHHFMQQIDSELRRLQGHRNPLKYIATELAEHTRLLCFDEFMVNDIAYALMLADLLHTLFAKGVVLVATSNLHPDNLYLKGLNRHRFLPAIAAIKAHCDLIHLGEKKDYRLGRDVQVHTYLTPLNQTTEQQMRAQFKQLAPEGNDNDVLSIQHRTIPSICCGEKTVWFDFRVICNLPRSQLDYLEIAERFDTVFVSNIPLLSESEILMLILLIHFIDVMYDRGIRLIISAEGPISALYQGQEMQEEFKRTVSRLTEMQSSDYLHRHTKRGLSPLLTV